MLKAKELINNLKLKEENIVLACSYGPDSMVLLDILMKLKINVIVAHVNHKLRKESDEEELLLEQYCEKHNLVMEKKIITNYPKGNFESNAREIRYDFFEAVLEKYNSKYLFTAHHGDDLIETVLMRLTRGSSLKGYGGFVALSTKKNYNIVRPLIFYSKEEIFSYAKKQNVPYAIDHTNNEEIYMRNKYRINILPELKKENINIHKKFLDFSEEIMEYEEYFSKKTNEIYNDIYQNRCLNLNEFNKIENIFKKRILQRILLDIYKKEIKIINSNHVDLILELIKSDKKNSSIDLPNNINVYRTYDKLRFKPIDTINVPYNYVLKSEKELEAGTIITLKEEIKDKSNYILRINSSEIKLPLIIRNRISGDKIAVKNLDGTKKINDIYIDEKLSFIERNLQPIVTDSEGLILWIPGIKKSVFDKQITETYDIILKYKKKEKINEK